MCNESTTRAAPIMMRFVALDMVRRIIHQNTNYGDTQDYFHLLMDNLSLIQKKVYTFLPKWTSAEDNAWLHKRYNESRVYATHFYSAPNPVPRQYIMTRNNGIRIQPRVTMPIWHRVFPANTMDVHQLWAFTHCETPLIADIVYTMTAIGHASDAIRTTRVYPGDPLSYLGLRMTGRFPLRLYFPNQFGEHCEDAQFAPCQALAAQFETIQDPTANVGSTTQPMKDDMKEWIQRMHNAIAAIFAGAANQPRLMPPAINADINYSYAETKDGRIPDPVVTASDNTLFRDAVPAELMTPFYNNPIEISYHFPSLFSFNTMFLRNFIPAVRSLSQIRQGDPQTPNLQLDIVRPLAGAPTWNGTMSGLLGRVIPNRLNGFLQFVFPVAAANHTYTTPTPPLRQFVEDGEILAARIDDLYKKRLSPFTYPGYWLVEDPAGGAGLVGIANWNQLQPARDIVNGILIDLPVAVGPIHAIPAADIPYNQIIHDQYVE